MTKPIHMTRREYKRLLKKRAPIKAPLSPLEMALRKAKSVFDAAKESNDLWMAKKYIEKALEILKGQKVTGD